MKLHHSAIEKIVQICTTYAGSPGETKIKKLLQAIDFTPYEQKLNENQDIILVLTEDFVNALKEKRGG
jgi:hypothetical protein